jgi:acetolactate synthase-1/2/3 large subunit
VTGKVSAFAPDARVIHIDVDPSEMNKVRRVEVPIVGDCKEVLTELLRYVEPRSDLGPWRQRVGKWKQDHPLEVPDDGQLHSEFVVREIARLTDHGVVVATDVGQHQMWAAQHFGTRSPRQFITSGAWARWALACPPLSARSSRLATTGRSGASRAMARSRCAFRN